MTSPVRIRAFAPEDMNAVIDLLQDVSEYRPAENTISALAQTFTAQSDCYSYVAIKADRLIAFGSMFVLKRVRGGCSGLIEDVVVAADVRGQGVGRQIVDALVSVARERGCFKVSLEAAGAAQSFYKASGFTVAGQAMKILL